VKDVGQQSMGDIKTKAISPLGKWSNIDHAWETEIQKRQQAGGYKLYQAMGHYCRKASAHKQELSSQSF
jgi:hypothetical protein